MKFKVRVPATTANFGSGFDCVGSALKLYNEIEVEHLINKNKKLKIEIEGEGEKELPRNEKNILWQAMQKVFNILRFKPQCSFKIKMINRIPLARGLGSSGAAIISGLVIANKFCGDKLTEKEILNIAIKLEGHPDNVVPAILGGFCVVVKTENNEIEYLKFDMPESLKAVLCIPEFNVSTEYARKILPSRIPYSDAVFN
ncbi:MAG: homoserine kinase, partial [Endomicrobiia bacterium]